MCGWYLVLGNTASQIVSVAQCPVALWTVP